MVFIKAASSSINLCYKTHFSTFFCERQERITNNLNPDVSKWQKVLYCHTFFSSMEAVFQMLVHIKKKRRKEKSVCKFCDLACFVASAFKQSSLALPIGKFAYRLMVCYGAPSWRLLTWASIAIKAEEKIMLSTVCVCKGRESRRVRRDWMSGTVQTAPAAGTRESPRDCGAGGSSEVASTFVACWFRSCTGMSQSHCNPSWPLLTPLKCTLMLMCF